MSNFALPPVMRRRCVAGCAAVSAAFFLVASGAKLTAAADDNVYYLRSFSDWGVFCGTVSCGQDEFRYDKCALSARSAEGNGADSHLEITRGPEDTAVVTLRARVTMPDSPFYLRVDDKPPHQTMRNHTGEGSWSGLEAQAIIDELDAGQRVVIRTFVGPPPSPRDAAFSLNGSSSLNGFSEAMADFGNKASIKTISQDIPPNMPPPPPVAAEMSEHAAEGGSQVAVEQAAQKSPTAAPAALPETREPAERATSAPDMTDGSPHEAVAILDEHVGRAQLTTNVVNREPIDELGQSVRTASSRGDYVYFFTDIRDLTGQTVTHRWEYGGSMVMSMPFRIGGDRWRVFSRKSIAADQTGPWSVIAIGPSGNVLARAAFTAE